MTQPQRRRGRWYFKFYSRGKWPFYSGSIVVDKPSEAFQHFKEFVASAREHSKINHTKCDCCYHPRIQ